MGAVRVVGTDQDEGFERDGAEGLGAPGARAVGDVVLDALTSIRSGIAQTYLKTWQENLRTTKHRETNRHPQTNSLTGTSWFIWSSFIFGRRAPSTSKSYRRIWY